MINMGSNPHVLRYDGKSEYDNWSLSGLSNIPSSKSVYFQLSDIKTDMPSAWEYKTGVYGQGQFGEVKGSGGEGIVIERVSKNQTRAAFKFVEVRSQKYIEKMEEALADMDERLSEMTNQEMTKGTRILKFEAHYR